MKQNDSDHQTPAEGDFSEEKEMQTLNRRSLMGRAVTGLGAGAILASCDLLSSSESNAKDDFVPQKREKGSIKQSVSEHARKTSLPDDAWSLPRYKPAKTGNFDLSKPLDNHMAWAKVQCDVAGGYSYLGQYGWLLVAPPGQPAYPILGRLTLAKVFLTPASEDMAPDLGEHDYAIWGTITTTHVDPRTFKPVDKIYNPYIDREIDVPTIDYADRLVYRLGKSIIVPGVDPVFYDQPWDRDGGYSQFNIDAGDEISYVVLGSSQHPGPQQPRCDVGFWTPKRSDLMNPNLTNIRTRRDYSVIQKLSEYPWYGAPVGDEAQLMVHLTGAKYATPEELPLPIKQHVYDRFKDRFDA